MYNLLPAWAATDRGATMLTLSRIMRTMPKRRRRRRFFLIAFVVITIPLAAWAIWRYHGPAPEREIFRGIRYSCERLPDTPESGGLLYLIRADLSVPGVSL